MSGRHFMEMLRARWKKTNSLVCVGLDSDIGKIPASYIPHEEPANRVRKFNADIVTASADLVCAYKVNYAFYAQLGIEGLDALENCIEDIRSMAPDVPIILDAKRGDIGKTNVGYVAEAFDHFNADAVTVNPIFGKEALEPFLAREDKGIIVLCRTSNKGAGEFQDLLVDGGMPLYLYIAKRVAEVWNENGNCMLVAGATYPEELGRIRSVVGNMPLLVPGIGTQGGDVETTVRAGRDTNGIGLVINSSSGIIFASDGLDFDDAARQKTLDLRDLINQFRGEVSA